MNILMVHPHDLFSKEEPWTTRIRNIAAEFKKKGHAVKIAYFPLKYKAHQQRFFIAGIEFIPLSRRVGVLPLLFNIGLFRKECVDIIHFQKCFYHAALPALIAAFLGSKPIHYDWDDWEIKIFHYSGRQPRLVGIFLSAWERLVPMLCDTVSVSSMRLREECINYGVARERIALAPVGADLEVFHPAISGVFVRERYNIIEEPLVSYIGQLHGGQYAEQFIRAAKIVLNRIPSVKFMVVGGGYRLEELKKMARDLALEESVVFTGALTHQEVPLYMAATDVAVACFEDNDITRCKSPLKIVEYMASGKAIVASDVGEVKRMIGGAGILTAPGDSQALAQGILKLLDDEPLRKRLALKARQRAEEQFNWANTAENLLKVYKISLNNVKK